MENLQEKVHLACCIHYSHIQDNRMRLFHPMLVSFVSLSRSSFFSKLKYTHITRHYNKWSQTPPSKTFATASLPISNHWMPPTSPSNVDLHEYLDAIEQKIKSGKPTFKVRLRNQNQKPIIRTLLGFQSKDEFDKLLRTQQKRAEYEKMKDFCLKSLQPSILSLSDDDRIKAPQFEEALELALGCKALKAKGAQAFHRLASGRVYKGKLIDLVIDLVPELEQQCKDAMMPLQEHEVLIQLIHHVGEERDFDGKDERMNAAMKCVALFQNKDSDGSDGAAAANHFISKANGLECEQICADWLTNQTNFMQQSKRVILSNVMINNNTTKSRQKYLNSNKNWNTNINNSRSIMWTSSQRDRVCSEFDAVVIRHGEDISLQPFISEIWEAKYCMSPSSIHDALTKKVPAIKTILQDLELSVSYDGFQQKLGKQPTCIVLGLFGMELLPPENALGQLRSTAISYSLTTDLDVALKAVDNGFVELGIDTVLHDLKNLRQKYVESSQYFDIVVKIASAQ